MRIQFVIRLGETLDTPLQSMAKSTVRTSIRPNALFKKLWPKLINASAAEAFVDLDATKKFGPVKEEAVKACLDDAGKAKRSQSETIGQARVEMQQTDKNVLFRTSDGTSKQLVHINCLSK
jgi:hypothetical protein